MTEIPATGDQGPVARPFAALDLTTIDNLMTEGRGLEVEVADYAKRVREVTAGMVALDQAFPDRNRDALRQWSRYAQLWEVVDDLITILQLAIDESHAGDARWTTMEETHA